MVQQHLKKTRLKGQTVKLFTLYPHHGGQMKLLPEALWLIFFIRLYAATEWRTTRVAALTAKTSGKAMVACLISSFAALIISMVRGLRHF